MNNSDLQLRPATDYDVNVIVSIMNESLAFKLSQGDTAWGTEPYTTSDIAPYINKGFDYLAMLGHTPVARIVIRTDNDPVWKDAGYDAKAGYLHSLAVRSAYRGRALGEDVILLATELLSLQGKAKVRLDCPADNTRLCAYYEDMGFNRIGTSGTGSALYEKVIS